MKSPGRAARILATAFTSELTGIASSDMSTAKRARPLSPAASRSSAVRPAPADLRILEGRITAVLADGRVKLVKRGGATLLCRCPPHVNVVTARGSRVARIQGGTVRIN